MLRVESNTNLEGFTEFEEDILFDRDDPDFDHTSVSPIPLYFKIPSNMSLASVHPLDLHSSHGSLSTLSHSLDDITGLSWTPSLTGSDHVLTIEGLRLQLTCCFTCGVSWADDHVSLDCTECGGYAMERPCPLCDGSCGAIWKRDLSTSHASGKGKFQGECCMSRQQGLKKEPYTITPQELSSRLEKLEKLSAHT